MPSLQSNLSKYIGMAVVIIYQDRSNRITKRQILIRSVTHTHVRATCLESGGPRLFKLHNILAHEPVIRDVG
ncbi:hypothetical protein [Paenibacillus sp. CF384]|uniref:hypothetical protein n=1 Tax=Paenibacillus sp. CF384 TaxID=1884382 RepID=UPI00089D67AC|nr:hypothetical protein [Paenibacillus sp. CF384]SDW22848.1 hypothetical protein SAMN05518855_1001727 [Paenibacillus sp. CF384]SDW23184.1 hypothetical protein SAMN05518855_1001738 [Paenibacillus sp. CF384]